MHVANGDDMLVAYMMIDSIDGVVLTVHLRVVVDVIGKVRVVILRNIRQWQEIVGWIDELFKINKADAVAIALSPLVSTRGSAFLTAAVSR